MAIQDTQKVDFLLKKVGYEIGKTAPATSKTPDNETKASPIIVSSENLWLDPIPENSATASDATARTFTILTFDPTSLINNKKVTWLAPTGDWISKSYGNYGVSIYVADESPVATGVNALQNSTLIQPAGINDDGYFIDYAAGIIHFADTNIPSVLVSGKALYMDGYRYVGKKGSEGIALNTLDLTQFANTSASGLQSIINETTGSGALVFQSGAILSNPTFVNGVTISGNLTVTGTGIAFEQASVVLQTLSVAGSGNFGQALTVSGVHVSLSGHQHPYTDITNFCSGVADCVNTQLVGGSGISLVYNDSNPNNTTLTVALSGSALNLHALADTGLIVKKSDGTFVGRSLSSGNNISISDSNGINGSPTISLVSAVSGLTSLTVDQLKLDGNTISSTDTGGNIILQPDGAGDVYLNADTIRVGDSNTNVKITSNGTGDLTLDTNSGTNSSYITIFDGVNGDITLQASGEVNINKIDVDGGNIDGTTIGSSSAAAATVTSLTVNNSGSITGDLIIGGNLTVNGTSVVANVSTMEVEDPIITLGVASGNIITSDSHDRGLALKFANRTAFMGYDSDANKFVLLGSGVTTDNGNTYTSGVYGDLHIKDLDAVNINGSTITASTKFSGPGTDLSGSGVNFTAGKATNLVGGDAGKIPYQTAPGTTTFLSIGTSGQFLRVNDGASAPYWDTVDYAELSNLPTIGTGLLTLGVSGSGLTGSATFGANDTGPQTFTVTSNATSENTESTIVFRDSNKNFSAGTITANLSGTATNALNIEIDSSLSGTHQLVFVNGINGNLKPLVNANLRFDAANNILLGDDGTIPTTKIQYFIIDGGTP